MMGGSQLKNKANKTKNLKDNLKYKKQQSILKVQF